VIDLRNRMRAAWSWNRRPSARQGHRWWRTETLAAKARQRRAGVRRQLWKL